MDCCVFVAQQMCSTNAQQMDARQSGAVDRGSGGGGRGWVSAAALSLFETTAAPVNRCAWDETGTPGLEIYVAAHRGKGVQYLVGCTARRRWSARDRQAQVVKLYPIPSHPRPVATTTVIIGAYPSIIASHSRHTTSNITVI